MAGLALLFNQDDVRSFFSPDDVTLWSGPSHGVLDLGDEVMMKISPQPAGLDIGVHTWKWRFHEELSHLGFFYHSFAIVQDTRSAGHGQRPGSTSNGSTQQRIDNY